MNLYRVLAKGASASGPQTALSSENNYAADAPVTQNMNTVDAGPAETVDVPLTERSIRRGLYFCGPAAAP